MRSNDIYSKQTRANDFVICTFLIILIRFNKIEQEMTKKWQDLTRNDQEMTRNYKTWQEMTRNDKAWQEMTRNKQEMTRNKQEMTRNKQEMTRNDKKWHGITRNDKKWPRNKQEMTKKWARMNWKYHSRLLLTDITDSHLPFINGQKWDFLKKSNPVNLSYHLLHTILSQSICERYATCRHPKCLWQMYRQTNADHGSNIINLLPIILDN